MIVFLQTPDSDSVNFVLAAWSLASLHTPCTCPHCSWTGWQVGQAPGWGAGLLAGPVLCVCLPWTWKAKSAPAPKRKIQTTNPNSLLPRTLVFSCCPWQVSTAMDRQRCRLTWLQEEGQLWQLFNVFSSMGMFTFSREERKEFFCYGEKSRQRPGCSKIPEDASPESAEMRKQQKAPGAVWVWPTHETWVLSFLLRLLQLPFVWAQGCTSKSTIKSPLCLCGRWQMHGGHLVLPRQAGHLLWLMLSCRKKWAGKELQWRVCRLEGDILISPALSSLLAFGDEMPSGGKCRGYWCKTAWDALCQVAVYSFC